MSSKFIPKRPVRNTRGVATPVISVSVYKVLFIISVLSSFIRCTTAAALVFIHEVISTYHPSELFSSFLP